MAEEEKKESDLKEEIIGLRERIAHQEGRKEGENWRWQRIGLIVAAAAALGFGTLFLLVSERAETVQNDIIGTVEAVIIGTAERRQAEIINEGETRQAGIIATAQTREAEIRLTAESRETETSAAVATAYAKEFSGFQESVATSNAEMTETSYALIDDFSTAVSVAANRTISQSKLIEISTNLISSRLDQLDIDNNFEQSFADRVEAGVILTLTAMAETATVETATAETATAAALIPTPPATSTPE